MGSLRRDRSVRVTDSYRLPRRHHLVADRHGVGLAGLSFATADLALLAVYGELE